MKKVLFQILSLSVSIAFLSGCTRGYESQKIAGEMKITVKADHYPLAVGDNSLRIRVNDSAGKQVTDAIVVARLYMPPMPGMPSMDSSGEAALTGDAYVINANAAMEGGWKLDVTETQPGKPPVTATFNLDAR